MKILHIPRTGGTAIKSTLIDGYRSHPKNQKFMQTKIKDLYICDHTQKLNNKDKYIFFVRDPIKRFLSHFMFLKKHAWGYDTHGYFKNLDIDDKILDKYNNINDLANDIHKLKFKLMIRMSDILISPENIEKCKDNILFVGRTEYLDSDFVLMQLAIGNHRNTMVLKHDYANKRPPDYKDMTKLNEKSKQKLREYLNLDYQIIISLIDLGFLPDTYINIINY